MTFDGQFVTTIIAIAGATAAIMSKMGGMATKADVKEIKTELKADLSKLDVKLENFRSEVAAELREVRRDINIVTKMYGEHGERLASLEAHK
jgi:ribosomal protein L29